MSSGQIDAIETLLSQAGGPPPLDFKLALTRLSAELQQRIAKGSSSSYDFFLSAVQALSRVKGVTHADLRLGCLWDSGLFFYRSGHAQPALYASDLMGKLARRADSKPWIRKAHTLAGIVQMEAGNVAEAIMQYADALRLARQLGEKDGEAAVLVNLGSAFNYAALHQEAASCLASAIDLCKASAPQYLSGAYCDIAQTYLALEQWSRGFEAIRRCLEVSDEPVDAATHFSRTVREYTFVQLALELGKLAQAREHAVACRRYSTFGDNARCNVLAEIACGLCEIRGGDTEAGLRMLQRALMFSGEFVASRMDALSALVKAYDELGRPNEALTYLNQLLALVRKARERSIGALLSLPRSSAEVPLYIADRDDVRALELREAKLRAKVAENELLNSRLEMLERLAITADVREEASGEHGYRVGKLAAALAEASGTGQEFCKSLETAARLHDIGKIGVPDRILFTSSELQDAERHFMCSHTVIGAELLAKSNIPQLQLAEQVARHHHEWWDGTGYPSKLSGKRIPIAARMVSLADVFDALTHGRPYSPAWTVERAISEIRARRGTQFDPDLTDRFLRLVEALISEHSDIDAYLTDDGAKSPFLQARKNIRRLLDSQEGRGRTGVPTAPICH